MLKEKSPSVVNEPRNTELFTPKPIVLAPGVENQVPPVNVLIKIFPPVGKAAKPSPITLVEPEIAAPNPSTAPKAGSNEPLGSSPSGTPCKPAAPIPIPTAELYLRSKAPKPKKKVLIPLVVKSGPAAAAL